MNLLAGTRSPRSTRDRACRAFALVVSCAVASLVWAGPPLPGFYQDPGLPSHRSTVNHNLDEHIDPFTGMLQLQTVDDTIPGNGGFDLSLRRSYNNPSAAFGTTSDTQSYNRTPNLGVGWNLLIGGRLYTAFGTGGACGGGNQMAFETPDGGRQALLRQGDGTFLSAARWKAVCVVDGVQVWAPNGTRYDMFQTIVEAMPVAIGLTPFNYPTRIEDRNGNFATFTYTTLSSQIVLDNVATSDGRLVTFGYTLTGSVQLLTSVTSAGRTWTYTYYPTPALADTGGGTGAYFLERVDPPSGGYWQYDYYLCGSAAAGACALMKVWYPEGGTMTYTYGFANFNDGSGNTPVVTNKVVGGAVTLAGTADFSWSFAYFPGSLGVPDRTEVTSNLGKTIYKHVGHSTVASGSTWQIGLLVEREHRDTSDFVLQSETFTWDKQQIASVPTVRAFGANDGVTYAPLAKDRALVRGGATYTTTHSNWDAYGNAQTTVETGQRARTTTRTYFVDTTKWIVNVVKDETITGTGGIARLFDANGNLTTESRFGVSTGYTYHPSGAMASKTDARGKTAQYLDYHRGTARQEVRPEGVVIDRVVDTHGNIIAQTDGAGHNYSYSYDAIRRLNGRTPPIGNPTTIEWTQSSIRTETRGALIETTTMDGLGYPHQVVRGGITTRRAFDVKGRRVLESVPGGVLPDQTIVGYLFPRDSLGRVTRVTNPNGTERQFTFGGSSVTERDELVRNTSRHFVAFGDPDKHFVTQIDLPDNSALTIGRDDLGNITSVAKGGVTRTYGYNGSYFLTSISDPETGVTTFGRDAIGNMTSRTVGGQATTFAYDDLNRLSLVTYPGGSTVAITYLGNGKTATVVTPTTSWTYGYDNNANLTSEILVVGGYTFAIGYTYNADDALAAITYPRTNAVVTYAPDTLGRPSMAAPFVTSATYFDSGGLKEINYANGIRTTHTENVRQWIETITTRKADLSRPEIVKKSYAYDGAGNVLELWDDVNPGYSVQMTYDNVDQLLKTLGPWGEARNYYDGAGNLTQYNFNGVIRNYTYTGNKLTAFDGRTFTYDSYGNVTGDGRHTYQYDHASNLTCVDCGTGQQIAYAYDGNNRRVSRTQNGVTTYYVHAGNGDLLLEFTPSTNKAIEHVYLRGKRVASRNVQL